MKINDKNKNVTNFESMSNELLMELFEYYDLYSLFSSFFSLSVRFDTLLVQCHVCVDLDRVLSIDFAHFLIHLFPRRNPYYIRSLRASNSRPLFSLAHEKFLRDFAHIRSLTLNNIRLGIVRNLVEHVHFYRLERVSFDQIKWKQLHDWSFYKHFFESDRYLMLKTYKDSTGYIEKGTSILSIEHLLISNGGTPWDFLDFLHRSPRLKFVHTRLQFDHHLFLPVIPPPVHSSEKLTNLHLQLDYNLHIPTITCLFQCIPRVRKLHLTVFPDRDPLFVDPELWESLLSTYLLDLKRLYLRVFTYDVNQPASPNWKRNADKHVVRAQIQASQYWRAHGWRATYQRQVPTVLRNAHTATFEVV